MDNETFEIEFRPYWKDTKYRMQVEIIDRSEQVIRFKITGGDKTMTMEKQLLKHKGQWKIKEMNFQLKGDPKVIAKTIDEIRNEIEFYLAGRPAPVNKYKDKP
jgi:hypothetical protein